MHSNTDFIYGESWTDIIQNVLYIGVCIYMYNWTAIEGRSEIETYLRVSEANGDRIDMVKLRRFQWYVKSITTMINYIH